MVDVVVLAFARPDARYAGGLDLGGTGLQFPHPGAVVRDAVARLHRNNPGTRVLLGIGGQTYGSWAALDTGAIALLVGDLGLDGVDVDFEPADPRCVANADGVRCMSDGAWKSALERLRAAPPRPAMLSVPGWSVGAFGAGPWRDARPRGPWTGSMLAPLRDPGMAAVDLVSVMAYGAGAGFDATRAYAAYRAAWPGALLGGVSVAAGTPAMATQDGLMIYGWLTRPPPGAPDAPAIAMAACRAWRATCE